MAIESIGHLPNLTADALMKAFEKHFGHRYAVYPTPPDDFESPSRDFLIVKSNLTAIGVRLEQKRDDTRIVYDGRWATEPPFSWFVPVRTVLLWITVFSTNSMMREVREFIATGLTAEIESFIRQSPEGQHYQRGLELGDEGRWQEAIAEFDRALSLNPDLAAVRTQRGLAYAELGQGNQAIADLERAKEQTDDPRTITNIEAALKVLRERHG